jgi:hypothetical protein
MKEEIAKIVENGVGCMFVEVHSIGETKSGDITPEQTSRLDKIMEDLANLISEQVEQNK